MTLALAIGVCQPRPDSKVPIPIGTYGIVFWLSLVPPVLEPRVENDLGLLNSVIQEVETIGSAVRLSSVPWP